MAEHLGKSLVARNLASRELKFEFFGKIGIGVNMRRICCGGRR